MKTKTKISFIVLLIFLLTLSLGAFSMLKTDKVFATENPVSMTVGAWIRADSEENSGIKFQGKVNKSYYDGLITVYGAENVYAGIIIVPVDYVKKAGGITLESLNSAGLTIGKAETSGNDVLKTEDENYTFFATINKILDNNYTREFSSVSYVKVVSKSAVDGFDYYDGAYYKYADFNETNNSRDVYNVAAAAFAAESTTEDEKSIIKNYLDGVASVVNDNGEVSLQQIDGYTSPFTLKKLNDNEYAILSETDKLKGLKYNDERNTDYRINDGDITVGVVMQKGASFDEENNVTMDTKYIPGSTATINFAEMDNNYIAFKGNYGIGTYVSFSFKGNNLPQVMLFANEINGNMSNQDYIQSGTVENGNKGLLISNGMVCNTASNSVGLHKFFISGHDNLNRINGSSYEVNAAFYAGYKLTTTPPRITNESYAQMTQIGLNGNFANNEYYYSVGTFLSDENTVTLDIYLYKKVGEYYLNVLSLKRATTLTESDVAAAGTNIITYATVKGTDTTTFSYKLPTDGFVAPVNLIETNGATLGGNKVTLNGNVVNGAGYISQLGAVNCSYIAFTNYTVGKYMEYTFTGNNMPQITFFANQINGNLTNYSGSTDIHNTGTIAGNTGISLFNGFEDTSNNTNGAVNYFCIWGNNRVYVGTDTTPTLKDSYLGLISNAKVKFKESGTMNYFTQTGLKAAANVEFKYVIGTKIGEDGKVHIDGTLTSQDGLTTYGVLDYNTNLTKEEAEALGSNVIAFGTVKGTSNATVFSYGLPFIK